MINTKELRSAVESAGLNAISKEEVLELLDRLEAAEAEAIEQACLNGMGSEREAALMAKLEAAEKDIILKERIIDSLGSTLNAVANERDALRALVVMRFDHDYPPQFTQGHDLHELTEPVTAEHCRWFVAEIERLRTDCDALRAKIEAMEKQEPVAWTTKLALTLGNSTLGFDACRGNLWGEKGVPLYARPVPAPSVPHPMNEFCQWRTPKTEGAME